MGCCRQGCTALPGGVVDVERVVQVAEGCSLLILVRGGVDSYEWRASGRPWEAGLKADTSSTSRGEREGDGWGVRGGVCGGDVCVRV